jgi:hypothetical protein
MPQVFDFIAKSAGNYVADAFGSAAGQFAYAAVYSADVYALTRIAEVCELEA